MFKHSTDKVITIGNVLCIMASSVSGINQLKNGNIDDINKAGSNTQPLLTGSVALFTSSAHPFSIRYLAISSQPRINAWCSGVLPLPF